MPTITALTIQKRNKERVNIFLDGEFAFGLAAITAAYLRVGQELTAEKIAELKTEGEYESAKQAAMNFISYRPRSETEVRRKLREKKFDAPTIDRVIERFSDLDLINDASFARYWVEQRESFKPRSKMALRQELAQKGVPRDVVDAALEDVDETAAARRAAEKKAGRWAHLPRQEFDIKLSQFLQRRGFSYGIIREILDDVWKAFSPEGDTE